MSALGAPFTREALAWLAEALRSKPRRLRLAPMSGSTSSTLYRVELEKGAGLERYVLRLIDNAAWLAEEPNLAEHEWTALLEARRAGLKAPAPVAPAGVEAGFGAPVVLMSFVEGEVRLLPSDFQAWIRRIASELAAVHAHGAPGFRWRYRSWVRRDELAPPRWSAEPGRWEEAIARFLEGEPAAPACLIHRDYHPANLLWLGDEISGVVDWINACLGPAGVDVAHCRTDLALMHGPEVAQRFLEVYTEASPGYVHDPYWDLDSILDRALPRPAYHSPWAAFGLARIPAKVLQARLERHLRQVMRDLE